MGYMCMHCNKKAQAKKEPSQIVMKKKNIPGMRKQDDHHQSLTKLREGVIADSGAFHVPDL